MSRSAPRSGSFRPQNYRSFRSIKWVVPLHLEDRSAPHSGPHSFVKDKVKIDVVKSKNILT